MDKIQELLSKSGLSSEVAGKIVETMVQYKEDTKKSLQEAFDQKLAHTKKLFVEETEQYKKDLARRLQTFCETKTKVIEGQLAKQAALSEKQAVSKLQTVRLALEGIQLGDKASSTAEALKKAKATIRQLTEEREQAVTKANRQTALAQRLVSEARKVIDENRKLKKVVAESKVRPNKANNTNIKKSKPVTTAQPISEDVRKKPTQTTEIMNIANQID